MSEKRKYLPLGLNVKGRTCLMIGAGWEAIDKGQKLLESGAMVTFVAPDFSKEEVEKLSALGGKMVSRKFESSDLSDQFLAMLATKNDARLTHEVVDICRKKRILLCAIDQPQYCDVVNMSIYERGALKICISTDGVSPALAKKIRLGLESSFKDVPLEELMDSLAHFREKVEKEESDPSQRMKKLIDVVQDVSFEASIKLPVQGKK